MRIDSISELDIFQGLEPRQYACAAEGRSVRLAAGERLFAPGDEANGLYVVRSGRVEVFKVKHGKRMTLHVIEAGQTFGEVPLLSGRDHFAEGVAVEESELLIVGKEAFWRMMGDCPAVRERLLANMALRSQQMFARSLHVEKLAALGTMSAGLAHELNNPAAAARRASDALLETLQQFDQAATRILKPYLFAEEADRVSEEFTFQPIAECIFSAAPELGAMERSEREDELADWLEEQGVEDGFEMAESLVGVGFDKDTLADFSKKIVEGHMLNFLNWIDQEARMSLLAQELRLSTTRVSELATAMKSYAHSGASVGKVKIDLHKGLKDTLVILGHKLRKKSVEVVKEFDASLPEIEAYGSELNQVWTNVLDNAIDAVPKGGRVTLRTRRADGGVAVELEDNGSGIPEEVVGRIFEPSFTTKPSGVGTGLGLDIAASIVRERHCGTIEVDSEPGRTLFTVTLPETQP